MNGPILCIFARAPVRGRVKSRLAAEIGDDAALAAHVELVEHALARLARIEGLTSELWLDDADDPGARRWANGWSLPVRRQVGADLGERMHHALDACLTAGRTGVLVGTDCPTIDATYVRQAAAALLDHDVVLGPAMDGGYGLVGVARPVPELFRDIAWGSGKVLSETLRRAECAGRTVALLREVWDVDTAKDWRLYRAGPASWEGSGRV